MVDRYGMRPFDKSTGKIAARFKHESGDLMFLTQEESHVVVPGAV